MAQPLAQEVGAASTIAGAARGAVLLLALVAALVWVDRGDLPDLLRALREAPAGVAFAGLVYLPQIAFAGFAWAALIPPLSRPAASIMAMLRWAREGATTLLPAGGLVGQTLAARALMRRGLPSDIAAATATVDLTIEAVTQLFFTLGGLMLLLLLRGNSGIGMAVGLSLALGTPGACALILLQRRAPVGWLRARAIRWAGGRRRRWLARALDNLSRVQGDIRRLHAEPSRLLVASGLHMAAWMIGAVEVWGLLHLFGSTIGPVGALVIESIAQALRTAGFLLPGGILVQEAALVAACASVGVPPVHAVIVALVRRAREVLFGVIGLMLFRRVQQTTPMLSAL